MTKVFLKNVAIWRKKSQLQFHKFFHHRKMLQIKIQRVNEKPQNWQCDIVNIFSASHGIESANFIEKLGLRICHLCQLRYNSWLSEKTFGFLIAFVTMFPICFYMPRFFEMRSKEDIKVIFTGSKALKMSLGWI